MSALAGPYHVIALVLIVSGLAKLRDRTATAQSLRDVGATGSASHAATMALLLGGAEIIVGGAALTVDHMVAAGMTAALYAGFTVFLLMLERRAPDATCGCFGVTEAPPGTWHLLLNVAGVGVALIVAGTATPTLGDAFSLPIGQGLAYAVLLASATAAVMAMTTAFAELQLETTR